MKLKVRQSLIYSGTVYNPGEIVDIVEAEVIDRVKKLELVEVEETEKTQEINSNGVEVEETLKKSKSKK